MAGKTGADSIFRALELVCRTLKAYRSKLTAFITAAETAGVVTSTQAATAQAFVDGAVALCGIFALLADYNSL